MSSRNYGRTIGEDIHSPGISLSPCSEYDLNPLKGQICILRVLWDLGMDLDGQESFEVQSVFGLSTFGLSAAFFLRSIGLDYHSHLLVTSILDYCSTFLCGAACKRWFRIAVDNRMQPLSC